MAASLDVVVARLEGVAARLEAAEVLPIITSMAAIHPSHIDRESGLILLPSCNVQAKLTSSGTAQLPSARSDAYANAPSKSSSTASCSLQAWDSSISPLVSSFKAASEPLGSEVRLASQLKYRIILASLRNLVAPSPCLMHGGVTCRLPKQDR